MKFSALTECDQAAYAALRRVREGVEAYLNSALSRSSMAAIDMQLNFIPIVMPVDVRERYPERSKALLKQRTYVCAPYLNYEIFVSGQIKEQLEEYMRGIAQSVHHLYKFGLTPDQIAEFEEILNAATARVLSEHPDRTRQ